MIGLEGKQISTLDEIKLKRRNKAIQKGPWLQRTWKGLKRTRYLQLLILPGLIFFIIYKYVPMYGLIIAFKEYKVRLGFFGSEWIGLENFVRFVSHPFFFRIVKNTILLSIYNLFWSFPLPIILAIFLNEVRNQFYKRFVQTVSYLPHFISTVSVVSMLFLVLSPYNGAVNVAIGKLFGIDPIYFVTESGWFRTLFISSGIWQNLGWGAIIYLAALSAVDLQLYDAAIIDGASRLQKIRYISLPTIQPTIVILLILNIGHLMEVGTEKVLLLQNPLTYEVSDVIGTFMYRRGLEHGEYSFSTAVGLFNSVINLGFLLAANMIARKVNETSLW